MTTRSAVPPGFVCRGSGDYEYVCEQEHRCRRVARTMRQEVERLGDQLSPALRADVEAAIARFEASAAEWLALARAFRGW